VTASPEQLAARALTGDRAALEALCRALQGPIYRLAQRMLGHLADAEDATQEILVLVVTHLAQFRGDAKLLTWVYTIAARHLLRARASRAEARAVPVEEVARAIDAGLAITQDATALTEGEARVLARDVQRTCTQAMLLCLTREERIAIVLAELLGATDAIGGEICEVAPDAFRQRLARARAKLVPVLEERCGLVDAARPCRCTRQVIAKQRAGLRLPVYQDAMADGLDRASEQIGSLRRLGGVFGVDPPPEPHASLWARLVERLPDLLRR
jgi:RNA polymerase sigma factor (sigma-70 family)